MTSLLLLGLLAPGPLLVGERTEESDDLLDLPLVRRAAFGVAVANAVDELKEVADYTTTKNGGSGAVREVIEYILKRNGKWQGLMQRYLV